MADIPSAMPDDAVRGQLTLLNELLDRLDEMPGPGVDVAMEAIETLTAVYGDALVRVVRTVDAATLDALAADELVGHLLVLHDLHPDPRRLAVAEPEPAPPEPALIPVEALLRKPATL